MNMTNGPIGRSRNVKLNPSQYLVAGFAAVILVGACLLTLPVASATGEPLRFLDALFTATSATCVTGLVVVDTASAFSVFGEIVVISLIQVGGLGFMAMATFAALLLGRRITLRGRLVLQESLNQFTLSGLVRLTRYVLFTTMIVEGTGALILTLRFLPAMGGARAIYYGIFHAVSAFCNAGFDLFGTVTGPFSSITSWVSDPVVVMTIGSLIVLGGLGFPVIVELVSHRRGNRLSLHTRLVVEVTAILLIVGTIGVFALELTNPDTLRPLSWQGKILASIFHSITPRTAGFNSLDMGKLRQGTLFLTVLLMFIGASPSSTGGGIKTSTFGVLVASVLATIRGYDEVEVHNRRIANDLISKAIAIASLALTLVVGVTLVLTITERASFLEVLFETVSAFGTVGLTMGITPGLSDIGRVLIIATMFMGRLGPLTVMIALAHRPRAKANVHLAEEKVLIG